MPCMQALCYSQATHTSSNQTTNHCINRTYAPNIDRQDTDQLKRHLLRHRIRLRLHCRRQLRRHRRSRHWRSRQLHPTRPRHHLRPHRRNRHRKSRPLPPSKPQRVRKPFQRLLTMLATIFKLRVLGDGGAAPRPNIRHKCSRPSTYGLNTMSHTIVKHVFSKDVGRH
jgi:hypothetical protein